jgi:hypothetical protein
MSQNFNTVWFGLNSKSTELITDYWLRISDDFFVVFLMREVKPLYGHVAIAEFIAWDQGASNEAKDDIKAVEVIGSYPLQSNCV